VLKNWKNRMAVSVFICVNLRPICIFSSPLD
jgi:hypothetical protein